MFKILFITIFSLLTLYMFWRAYDENNIYTPNYKLIFKDQSFEIREYDQINIITTTNMLPYKQATNLGFKTLANYISGNNYQNKSISMTSPVLTNMPYDNQIDVSFIIEDNYNLNEMPIPLSEHISFKKLDLGKVAVIKFGFWATQKKIINEKNKLESFLESKSITSTSSFIIAQYNSPWIIPPFRKNEIIIQIK